MSPNYIGILDKKIWKNIYDNVKEIVEDDTKIHCYNVVLKNQYPDIGHTCWHLKNNVNLDIFDIIVYIFISAVQIWIFMALVSPIRRISFECFISTNVITNKKCRCQNLHNRLLWYILKRDRDLCNQSLFSSSDEIQKSWLAGRSFQV